LKGIDDVATSTAFQMEPALDAIPFRCHESVNLALMTFSGRTVRCGRQRKDETCTYGRVYYVEKKLLVFYAFDLEDKRRNRIAAGFQAWGYSQPNETKPPNLGLFHLDDASMNRWILSVKNTRILEHVDPIFVTLEPPDRSPSPRGRRLLYANIVGPPNHP
jgi:hypothetical protein